MKVWRILLIVFLFCGCTKMNPLTATFGTLAPERFKPFELNFSEPPEFNKPVELTMNVVEGGFPYPNAAIEIDLPDGFELVSGDLEWQGDLTKDVPVQLKAVVKPVKTGDWVIEAQIIDSGEGKRVRTALYVSVSEDSVEVSEIRPPGFGAESEAKPDAKPDAIESMITMRLPPCPNGTLVIGYPNGTIAFRSNESENMEISYSPGADDPIFECLPSS